MARSRGHGTGRYKGDKDTMAAGVPIILKRSAGEGALYNTKPSLKVTCLDPFSEY